MPQSEHACLVISLDHLVLTVADISRTLTFYATILGMRSETFSPASGGQRHALKFGAAKINLHQQGQEFDPKAAQPTPGSADLCFLTTTPLSEWMMHLSAHDVPVEEGPIPRTGAQGPLMSIYIRDPDQNLIEIAVQDR